MLFRRQGSSRGRRRNSTPVGPESLEGRSLLSAAPIDLSTHPRVAELAVTRQQARANHLAEVYAQNAPSPTPTPPAGTVAPPASINQQGKFVASTAVTGWKITHSNELRNVEVNYAKTLVGHDTRKVGLAYISAALKGDGKTLDSLGHTKAAKKVGNDFSRLGQSKEVKYIGDQFSHFGNSVASQFKRLFILPNNKATTKHPAKNLGAAGKG